MNVELREREIDAAFGQLGIEFFVIIVVYSPVVGCFGPGSHGKVHAARSERVDKYLGSVVGPRHEAGELCVEFFLARGKRLACAPVMVDYSVP